MARVDRNDETLNIPEFIYEPIWNIYDNDRYHEIPEDEAYVEYLKKCGKLRSKCNTYEVYYQQMLLYEECVEYLVSKYGSMEFINELIYSGEELEEELPIVPQLKKTPANIASYRMGFVPNDTHNALTEMEIDKYMDNHARAFIKAHDIDDIDIPMINIDDLPSEEKLRIQYNTNAINREMENEGRRFSASSRHTAVDFVVESYDRLSKSTANGGRRGKNLTFSEELELYNKSQIFNKREEDEEDAVFSGRMIVKYDEDNGFHKTEALSQVLYKDFREAGLDLRRFMGKEMTHSEKNELIAQGLYTPSPEELRREKMYSRSEDEYTPAISRTLDNLLRTSNAAESRDTAKHSKIMDWTSESFGMNGNSDGRIE